MDDSIIKVFDVIWKNADLIIHTNPYDLHLLVGLYESYVERENKSYIWYSTCFALPPFLCDVLKLKAPVKGIKSTSIPQLKPGNYYYFSVFSHDFSIVYVNAKNIYYIDYYSETQRLHPFRMEKLSLERLNIFLQALSKNDINAYLNFHAGSDDFNAEFRDDFQRLYNKKPSLAKLFSEVFEQKLASKIDVEDILRVLLKENPSFPMLDYDLYDYTKEDFEDKPKGALEEAQNIYQSCLEKVKKEFH